MYSLLLPGHQEGHSGPAEGYSGLDKVYAELTKGYSGPANDKSVLASGY
jgi:hypothetical protein